MTFRGSDGELQWHDGRRMVTVWVGRGQQWAESAREQAQRANRRQRHPAMRALLGLLAVPLGVLTAALGLVVFLLAAVIGIVVLGVVVWIGMGVAGAAMMTSQGRSGRLGWLLGMVLGPIGLLLIRRVL